MYDEIVKILPHRFRSSIYSKIDETTEELYFCAGQPPILRRQGREYIISNEAVPVSTGDLDNMVAAAVGGSTYTASDALRQGYITIAGGHRLGLCGEVAMQNGAVKSFRSISAITIRIAADRKAICVTPDNSTLILGPPGSGKTTLLRACVRLLSDNCGQRVSVVDERGEIAASIDGIPQFSVGRRTSVLTGVPKAEGIMMMLRSMNPQWIAVDEITKSGDCEALMQASYCGISLLATAHAESTEDLHSRPIYQKLMDMKIFKTILVLRPDHSYTTERCI